MAESDTKVESQCPDTGQLRSEDSEVTSASVPDSAGRPSPFSGVKPARFIPGAAVPGMNPFAARPAYKADPVSTSGSSPAKFVLRPSALSVHPQNVKTDNVSDVTNSSAGQSILKPAKLPDPTKKDQEEGTEKENTEETQPVQAEVTSICKDKVKDPPDSSSENLFQAALTEHTNDNKLPDSSSASSLETSNNSELPATSSESENILGLNLTKQVTGVNSPPKGVVSSSGFVFGENLAARVQLMSNNKSEDNGTASPDSTDQTDLASAATADSGKTLEESAREYQASHGKKTELQEVEVVTGEENESNVIQTNGKLFVFDGDTQNWIEKGRGLLRLNDMRCPASQTFQSRLLMRTSGSLRLILNTKIWPGMNVERASSKSVRITGTDGDSVRVFLIMTNPKDTDNIIRALDWRVQQLRVQEEKQKEDGLPVTTAEKRKADPEYEDFSAKKTKKSDDEGQGYRREESDSSVVDPETEVSSESHASSFTLRTDSD